MKNELDVSGDDMIGRRLAWKDKWGTHSGVISRRSVRYNARNIPSGSDWVVDCGADGERCLRYWQVRDIIREEISATRSAAGRAGAASRWGDGPRATACVRLYPADAQELRARAEAAGCMPADVVARMLEGSNAGES